MTNTKSSSKGDKAARRHTMRKVAEGPVVPTLGKVSTKNPIAKDPYHPEPIIIPSRHSMRKVAEGPVVPTLGWSGKTKKGPSHPGPIIEPLIKIHQMIKEGSINLEASPQNQLAAKKLKGLTQELGKYGFNIDIKTRKGK